MSSNIDISKLAKMVAESYDLPELEGFLTEYFHVRLDHIIQPRGLSLIEVVRKVIDHFDRRGNLVELVREFGKDRPGKIDLLSLLATPSTISSGNLPSPPSPTSSTT